jgi:putative transposase
MLFDTIKRKSDELDSPLYAINAVRDHLHVAVSISPNVAVAQWVKHIKGVSTHDINLKFTTLPEPFRWQDSYGVMTFGTKNLTLVTDYIRDQKTHHRCNTLYDYLERID